MTRIRSLWSLVSVTSIIITTIATIIIIMISPVDKDGLALVPGVGHLHASHHQAVHAATLTVQVHLGNIGLLLGYEL